MLFALARALGEAWPGEVPRDTLVARAFGAKHVGRTTPYLATGAGLAQYGAPMVSREGSVIGTQSRIAFEVNAGGGLKVPVSETWGMRTDARWFKSFGRNAAEHWRVAHGVSFDARKR